MKKLYSKQEMYLISEWFNVIVARNEWYEKVLETQSLSA